jgi:hypothetical protein
MPASTAVAPPAPPTGLTHGKWDCQRIAFHALEVTADGGNRRLKAIPVHASSTGIAVDYYDHTRSTHNGGRFPIKVNGEISGRLVPAVQNDVDCARAARS